MTLISTARGFDDQNMKWRIQAAVVLHASQVIGSATGNDYNFAISTLLSPQQLDPSMQAFALVDSAVSAAITVGADGTVNTDPVADADIARVVTASWSKVASKYKVNPIA